MLSLMLATDSLLDTTPKALSADDVLSPYIYVFYASFLIAFVFTPIMRQVALYYGIIDSPDTVRKLHAGPVAYMGGVAVALGWLAGLAISQFSNMHRFQPGFAHLRLPLSLLVAAGMIVVLGLWDDVRGVSPRVKLIVQAGAALMLLHGGMGTQAAGPLLAPVQGRLEFYYHRSIPALQTVTLIISSLLTMAVVIGCCNATNLMDGLDGLCGGVTAVIAAGFVFLAVHMAVHSQLVDTNSEGVRVVLGLALLGGVLGFIPYNFNPASIFLGDTGSMFIGFSCATLLVMMAQVQSKWFLAALVMFALPILDTLLAFARRYVNHRPFFSADRHHFHHQLVARGFTIKQTVIISYLLALGFVVLGAAITFVRTRYAVAFYMVIFGSLIVAAYKMGMVHEKRSDKLVGEQASPSSALPTVAPAVAAASHPPAGSESRPALASPVSRIERVAAAESLHV